MADIFSLSGSINLNTSEVISGLNSVNSQVSETGNNISGLESSGNNASNGIVSSLDKVGKGFTDVGSNLTKKVTVPITGLAVASSKVGMDFEAGMSKVQAISGATGSDLEKLTDKAKEMGAKTQFSASQSADALSYMALAGWKTDDMLNGLDGVMNLAAASGEDLASVSDIVTDDLTAFGMAASDSAHFADVLATTSANSNTNVSGLGEAFKYVGSTCGAMGYNVEDASVAIGLMANAGIKGSQAGNTLKNAIVNMVKPTDAMAGVMEKYGLSVTNQDGTMKSLAEITDMLREKMGGLSEEEKANAAATLFGKESMAGMLSVINASPADYEKLSGAINNCDGKAKEMADTMNNNTKGSITALKSAIEGLMIQGFDAMKPTIDAIVAKLRNFTEWLSKLSPETQALIIKIGLFVAAIGPVLLIIGKVITAVSSIIKVFSAVKTAISVVSGAFTLLCSPVGLVVAAIAAVVAIGIVLYKNWDTIKEKCSQLGAWISEKWNGIKESVSSCVEGIKTAVTEKFNAIINFFKADWKELLTFIINPFVGGFELLYKHCDSFRAFVNGFVENVKQSWENLKQGVVEKVEALKTGVIEKWEALKTSVGNTVEALKTAVMEKWEALKTAVGNTIESIKTFAIEKWEAIKTSITEKVEGLKTSVVEKWEAIKTGVVEKAESLKTGALEKFESVKATAIEKFNALKEGLSKPVEAAKELISSGIEKIKGLFNFTWSFPKLKLPHFSVSGSFSLDPPSVPHLGIDWYANGGIMTKPTMFGMNGSNAMVGGEAGPEAILPLDGLYTRLREIVRDEIGLNGNSKPILITVPVQLDGSEIARVTAPYMGEELAFNNMKKGWR